MARAIAVISASAATYGPLASAGLALAAFWHELLHPYRPELYYMRGPGPAWRAKYGLPPTA